MTTYTVYQPDFIIYILIHLASQIDYPDTWTDSLGSQTDSFDTVTDSNDT